MSALDLPDELEAAVTSSFQRVAELRREQERLAAEMREAVAQAIGRIGSAHRAGLLTDAQVCEAFRRFREEQQPGVTELWNSLVDLPWRKVVALSKRLPNGPTGSWVGVYPFPSADCPTPPLGQAVVYVLATADNEPVYVGSTDRFRPRMAEHARDGKEFVHWTAHPCRDRDQAYRLEESLLADCMPLLNAKAAR
ncbi:hypothetical protein RKD35_002901 [Streptomyces albogriseolus]